MRQMMSEWKLQSGKESARSSSVGDRVALDDLYAASARRHDELEHPLGKFWQRSGKQDPALPFSFFLETHAALKKELPAM